jgi:hypothetical protein
LQSHRGVPAVGAQSAFATDLAGREVAEARCHVDEQNGCSVAGLAHQDDSDSLIALLDHESVVVVRGVVNDRWGLDCRMPTAYARSV